MSKNIVNSQVVGLPPMNQITTIHKRYNMAVQAIGTNQIFFTALEVGSGDAFLLRDGEKTILFDSGGNKGKIFRLVNKVFNQSHKNSKRPIDIAICSHGDDDHAKGFIGLLEKHYPIKEMWLPAVYQSIILYAADILEGNFDASTLFGKTDLPQKYTSLTKEEIEKLIERVEGATSIEDYADRINKLHKFVYDNSECFNKSSNDSKIEDGCDKINETLWVRDLSALKGLSKRCRKDNESTDCGINRLVNSICASNNAIDKGSLCRLVRMFCLLDNDVKNIIDIVQLVLDHNRRPNGSRIKLRWFLWTCNMDHQLLPEKFFPLNSKEITHMFKVINLPSFLYLTLTQQNRESLVFDYYGGCECPIVRFSADSCCTEHSVDSYDNTIITAPHHGSADPENVIVYSLKCSGNEIWVRSDCKSRARPCKEFKSKPNKYCLACYNQNFGPNELHFEFINGKWMHSHGNPCRC